LYLLVQGASMIRRGFWPRRQGNEPHCRSCDYILIGLESQRCPECGSVISPLNTVLGQRQRRLGLAWTGVAFSLLGLVLPGMLAAMALRSIDWYHYEPAFMIMRDLRSKSPGVADAAMQELMRRDQAGDLATKYRQQIIEMGLFEQAGTGQGVLTQQLVEYVERQYVAGHLTDAQKTQFGRQCLILALRVRPIVVLGDFVPYQTTEACRVPTFWVRLLYQDDRTINIDGQGGAAKFSGGEGSMCGLGSGGASGGGVVCKSVGQHQLQVTYRVELHRGDFGNTDPNNLLFQEDRKLTGNFEVVAQPPKGYFSLIMIRNSGIRSRRAYSPTNSPWIPNPGVSRDASCSSPFP
jgi:hypothetical protein